MFKSNFFLFILVQKDNHSSWWLPDNLMVRDSLILFNHESSLKSQWLFPVFTGLINELVSRPAYLRVQLTRQKAKQNLFNTCLENGLKIKMTTRCVVWLP